MSLPRVPHKSEPEVAEKGHHSPLAMGEVILPADLEESPFLQDISQFTQSADVEDDVNKSSNSDSDLAIDKEGTNAPHSFTLNCYYQLRIPTEPLVASLILHCSLRFC